jgi:hypothetical protein
MAEKTIGTDVNQTEITSLNHIKGNPHIVELLRTSLDAYFQNRAVREASSFGRSKWDRQNGNRQSDSL